MTNKQKQQGSYVCSLHTGNARRYAKSGGFRRRMTSMQWREFGPILELIEPEPSDESPGPMPLNDASPEKKGAVVLDEEGFPTIFSPRSAPSPIIFSWPSPISRLRVMFVEPARASQLTEPISSCDPLACSTSATVSNHASQPCYIRYTAAVASLRCHLYTSLLHSMRCVVTPNAQASISSRISSELHWRIIN